MYDEIKDMLNEIIGMAETGHLNAEATLASIGEIAENIKEEIRILEYEDWRKAEEAYEYR